MHFFNAVLASALVIALFSGCVKTDKPPAPTMLDFSAATEALAVRTSDANAPSYDDKK